MKKVLLLSLISFLFSNQINGQSSKNSPADEVQITGTKSQYVKNQDYLSKSSLKDYKNFYGDSLKGFNEAQVKVDLLNRHYYGQEFISMMSYMKREYINQKYKIGPDFAPKPVVQTPVPSTTKGGKLGNNNVINAAPCVNEDFELTAPGNYSGPTNSLAVTGWTVENTTSQGKTLSCNLPAVVNWLPGSPEFSIVTTPLIAPHIGPLAASPLGGNNVALLNDAVMGYTVTRISQTFPVTLANTVYQFAYAGSWDGVAHTCCDQPFFTINMFNCQGAPLGCSSLSLTPPGPNCVSTATGYATSPTGVSYTNWQVKYIDLTPFVGTCVTIRIVNGDCNAGGHHGSLYFDSRCGGQLISLGIPQTNTTTIPGPVSFCSGSNQALISAPIGYATYQWLAPSPTGPVPIAGPQGTLSTLVVQNPVPGTVYTVNLTSPSGCLFVATNTIVFSQVNVAGVGSSSSCPLGANGSATVVGNGSGTGYNYTWLNSSSVTVGTSSVVNNLAPGVYSIVLTGLGAAGCGSAVATTTIGVGPPTVVNLFKPYCGNEAYLQTSGGIGHKWYSGNTLLTGSLATLPNYTVTNPVNNAVYSVAFTSPQGCKDSIRYTLVQSAPGALSVPPPSIKLICLGANNGTAAINMVPAPSAPSGFNSFYVGSTGSTPPYTASVNPTSSNTFTVGGLSQGSYTVSAFDGSCKYIQNFSVTALNWNFTMTPGASTLCPGNLIAAGVTSTSSPINTSYSYNWSPANWMSGTTAQNVFVTPPAIAPGNTVTQVITVTVTPALANCPITKTVAITNVNPPTPTISLIDPMCNTFAPVQIQVNPAGGTFINAPATPNLVGTSSGIITPSLGVFGTNSFVYSINVHTCTASSSATFQVSQFHPSTLTSTVPGLCVTNGPFNLMNIVQSTVNGTWHNSQSPPLTGVINGTHFNPALAIAGSPQTTVFPITYSTTSSPNPSVCPSTTTINVTVTNTLVPAITPVLPFCNNAGPITMTVDPPGGGWSGPNISASGVITPTNINNPGTSIVIYTVASGPCLNTAFTSFSVGKFNPATLSGSIPQLCASGNPVNLMSYVQSTVNGSWSGMGVQGTNFVPSTNFPLNTQTFQLVYTTTPSPSSFLCGDASTMVVSVFNPPVPTINLDANQAGPFCTRSNTVQLSASPATGQWISSAFLSPTGVFSPSLGAVGNNIVQYVVGSSTCSSQSSRVISVEAFVPATITALKLPDLCNTGTGINLSPYTLTNLGKWTGPGIVGTNFNPALAGKGDFVLTHTTASIPSGLCPDQSTVAISVHSLAVPAITGVQRVCNTAQPVQLNPTPVGGLFGGVNTGAVDQKGLFIPASGVTGDNIINYSITAGPCVAYAQTTVVIEKEVPADFASYPSPYCKSDKEGVNMNTFVQNPGGQWRGPGITGSMFYPSKANEGVNIITYTTVSVPTGLCRQTSSVSIRVNALPKVTAVSNADVKGGCAPYEVIFNVPDGQQGVEGEWIMGDGSEPKKGLVTSHIFTAPGSYSVIFNYTKGSCASQSPLASAIKVHETPKADFTAPEEVLVSNPEVQLTNLSTEIGANRFYWKIGTENSYEVNPKIELTKIGKYQITLVAETENGCKDEMTKFIEVKNAFNIYIPTSFTPNKDNLNDEFKPVFSEYGLDVKHYEMEIFDRWGHTLFRTKDPEKGWDGSVQNKGEALKEEVYVYRIKYKDLDGNSYTKMGHLSLTR